MLSSQYDLWLVRQETTYGTDAIDAAVIAETPLQFARVMRESAISPDEVINTMDLARPSQGAPRSSVTQQGSTVEIVAPMSAPAGVGNLALPLADLLAAAGVVATATPGVYRLHTVPQESVTVYQLRRHIVTDAWQLKAARGALTNLAITGNVNEEPQYSFAGLGTGPADWQPAAQWFNSAGTTMIRSASGAQSPGSAVSHQADESLRCAGATITFGGTPIRLSTWAIDIAWTIGGVEDQNVDPTRRRVVRYREGTTFGSATLGVEVTDNSAGLDALRTAKNQQTFGDLVIALQSTAKTVTIRAKIQITAIADRESGGLTAADVTAILVDDLGANPLGDNGFSIEVTE